MSEAIVSFVPTALALWLVTFGHDGSQSWPPTREQLALVFGGAVLMGPLALALLGVLGWLALVAAGTLVLMVIVLAREPGRPA